MKMKSKVLRPIKKRHLFLRLISVSIALFSMSACSMDSIPVLTIDIYIEKGKHLELEESLISFAEENGFSYRDNGRASLLNDGRKVLSVDFWRDGGVEMALGDYMNGERFWVAVYDADESAHWGPFALELVQFLNQNSADIEVIHSADTIHSENVKWRERDAVDCP